MNANRGYKAFKKFVKDVDGMRTIEQNMATVEMAVYGNMGG